MGFGSRLKYKRWNHLVRGKSEDEHGRREDGDEVDEEERVRLEQLVATSQTVVLRLASWVMMSMKLMIKIRMTRLVCKGKTFL